MGMTLTGKICLWLLILLTGMFTGFMLNEKYFSDPCPEQESINIESVRARKGANVTIEVTQKPPKVKKERKGLFKRKRYE